MPDDKPLTNDEFKEHAREEAASALFAVVHEGREWKYVDLEEKNDWYRLANAVADIRKDIWNGGLQAAVNVLEARMSQFITVANDPLQHAGMRGVARERAGELMANIKVIRVQRIIEEGEQPIPGMGIVQPGG